MRAGPAGHPGRRPDPRHHGPAQQAHRAAAMLIRASVQIVVDMIAPPGCRRSDPVRAGRVLIRYIGSRSSNVTAAAGFLNSLMSPRAAGNTFPPKGDNPIVNAVAVRQTRIRE